MYVCVCVWISGVAGVFNWLFLRAGMYEGEKDRSRERDGWMDGWMEGGREGGRGGGRFQCVCVRVCLGPCTPAGGRLAGKGLVYSEKRKSDICAGEEQVLLSAEGRIRSVSF